MKRTTSTTQALAEKLVKVYEAERDCLERLLKNRTTQYRVPRCWGTGSPGEPESRRRSVWLKLIDRCRAQKIDPVRYVQWVVNIDQVLLGDVPEPNQLMEAARMRAYVAAIPKTERKIRLLWECDTHRLKNQLPPIRGDEGGMWDRTLVHLFHNEAPVSFLMRFVVLCFAQNQASPNLVKTLFSEVTGKALSQFQYHPDVYYDLWGAAYLPAGFGDDAALYYEHVIGVIPKLPDKFVYATGQ
jgi:hypothetical protein